MQTNRIAVIGLGKLGLSFAVSLANAGYEVYGADIDEELIEQISNGVAPYPESDVQSYLDNAGNNLNATTDTTEAVKNSDATFVFVNTPLSESGEHSLDAVLDACQTIGEALPTTNAYHAVTIRSTVMPGSVGGPILETLEESSGFTAGEEFGLCYNPEFTAVGEIIDGVERPDFFLIGEHSPKAGNIVEAVCDTLRDNDAPIHRMSIESAELAKMVNNTYRTMKISFANTMGQLADGVGADIYEVIASLESDSVINTRYLSPAARYGGPCYSRDNTAFSSMAEEAGASPEMAEATDAVNDKHTRWIANAVRNLLDDGTVAILGLSYKPGTTIAENSQGVKLVSELKDEYNIVCSDPEAIPDAQKRIAAEDVTYTNPEEAVAAGDLVIITTPWEKFTRPSLYAGSDVTIVDLWRCVDTDPLQTVDYRPFGRGDLPGRLE